MGHYHSLKLNSLLCAACILVVLGGCSSKRGCIDPGSISYDPDAKVDNGTCAYPSYSLNPNLFTDLDNVFSETSGLIFTDNRVWTIVDEMEENKIYSIDLFSGNIKEILEATGLSAVDFEAVTSSSTHFYIGDFGNNDGNRTDLTIYKIPKPTSYSAVNMVAYETISFSYPEQTDFRSNSNSNFDAEALMFFNDNLYLLTKNHQNNETSLYEIPAHAGNHEAKIRGIFDTKGLITDAAISPSGSKMALLGYNKDSERAFIWILKDFSGTSFFSGKKMLVEIGSLHTVGQVEGIAFHNENNVFISNEQFEAVKANLHYLNISSVQ